MSQDKDDEAKFNAINSYSRSHILPFIVLMFVLWVLANCLSCVGLW
jgi:hypothetical protein